jgi:hypothetical protein
MGRCRFMRQKPSSNRLCTNVQTRLHLPGAEQGLLNLLAQLQKTVLNVRTRYCCKVLDLFVFYRHLGAQARYGLGCRMILLLIGAIDSVLHA